ncbi:exonuclease domain-containing protein [Actinomadura scrupuli]|uniref:exonuclease domain-containing protein n=1 Tax=Actinomadura scrupuli TaxID=559629 RepID=UPI003D996C59
MSWHNGPMMGLDFESSGVDTEADRIVQSALVIVHAAERRVEQDVRLINPGIEIPEAATEVHGITTARAEADGAKPAEALEDLAADLVAGLTAGWPIVGANLVYDLTLMDRELRRHGLATLEQRLRVPIAPVVDVMVIDKICHRFRKGGRKLTDLCDHYGVRIDGAHDAGADALAACRIAWRMVQWGGLPDSHFAQHPGISQRDMASVPAAYRRLAALPLADLHTAQVRAKKVQDAGLAEYFRSKGQAFTGLDGHWPMIPFTGQQAMS